MAAAKQFVIMKKNILILTCVDDIHTQQVARILREDFGNDPVILERERYGLDWTVTATVSSKTPTLQVTTGERAIGLGEIGAVWNRRDFTIETTKSDESPESLYIATQCAIHVNGFFRCLSAEVPFMNPPLANANASSKLVQARIATKHGLSVPRSYFGGSPEIANDFISATSSERDMCIKPLESTHLKRTDGSVYAHYNSIFRRRPLNELQSLKNCPVILQEFIDKKFELRVTVVGDRVLAASIDTSTASPEAKVDWRHYDWANTVYRRFDLPQEVSERLLLISRDLNLPFGAFDLIVSRDGTYHFLEVNSQGQWLWIEDLTELPISASVAEWLFMNANQAPAHASI